jgi:hypothetical protein
MSKHKESAVACAEYNQFSRRQFLGTGVKAGVLSALGLGMADYFRLAEASTGGVDSGKATSVVLVWLGGGPSHIDTWDPKPDAPAEVRGEFKAIEGKAGGVRICEHLPLLAAHTDKMAIVRSLSTGEAAHERGTHYMMTGFVPIPGFGVPSMGAVTSQFLKPQGALPPYIAVPGPVMYGGAGFLGAALDPFSPGGDPNNDGFRVRDLDLPDGMTVERMDRRRSLREAVDSTFARLDAASDRSRAVDSFYDRAYNLLGSKEARAAFAIEKETADVRNRYGRNQLGQSLLLARRLVEGGVRFVTVNSGGWDTHGGAFNYLRYGMLPTLDRSLSAFLDDLSQRGMLDRTLVAVMGEFGRTPVINRDGGRDHHARCFSMVLAGGGIKGGQVVGASDARGFEPAERPVRPEDISATIYRALGIDYTESLTSPEGVRITLSRGGRHLRELIA